MRLHSVSCLRWKGCPASHEPRNNARACARSGQTDGAQALSGVPSLWLSHRSGMVESGNTLLMHARLTGTGMHWQPSTLNPMLALRINLCNERWELECLEQQGCQHSSSAAFASKIRQRSYDPCCLLPSFLFPKPPTARTQPQRQWGQHTFSPRMLVQPGDAPTVNRTL